MCIRDSSNSDLTLTRGDDQISIVLPGAPTFDSGSDKIKEQAGSVLSVLGGILTEYDKTLVAVVGHSDAQGAEADNKALAQRRAIAIGEYLKGKHVARERLVVMSYGSKVPVADNNTPEGRAKNRRVELLLKPIAVPRIGG